MGFLKDLLYGPKDTVSSTQSTSTANSQQASLSDSYNVSTGRAGSTSTGRSGSTGLSGSQSSQGLAFEDFFNELFTGASGAASRAANLVPQFQQTSGGLFSRGMDFLALLEQDSALADRLNETGTEDQQVAQLQSDLDKFFNESLLPGVKSRGVSTGTLGGSRDSINKSLAAREVADSFARGATDIRARGVERRDALAQGADNLRLNTANAGLSAIPSVLGIGQSAINAELAPYQMLASIMGGPTVLGQSTSFGTQDSFSTQDASSFSLSDSVAQALSRAYGESTAESQSTGTGTARNGGIFDLANSWLQGGAAGLPF